MQTRTDHKIAEAHQEYADELKVHLQEYISLREEILSLDQTQQQSLNYTILIVGGILSALALATRDQIVMVLLLLPLFFTFLSITFVSRGATKEGLAEYINNKLRPAINACIHRLDNYTTPSEVLQWEQYCRSASPMSYIYWGNIRSGAEYLFLLLPGPLSIFGYLFSSANIARSWYHTLLFAFDIVAVLLAISFAILVLYLRVTGFFRREYQGTRRSGL